MIKGWTCPCYIHLVFAIDSDVLYSNHDGSVLVPAQKRVLSVPRLRVLDIGPSLEEVLMLHDAS